LEAQILKNKVNNYCRINVKQTRTLVSTLTKRIAVHTTCVLETEVTKIMHVIGGKITKSNIYWHYMIHFFIFLRKARSANCKAWYYHCRSSVRRNSCQKYFLI